MQSPLTFFIFGLTAGYYIVYQTGLFIHSRDQGVADQKSFESGGSHLDSSVTVLEAIQKSTEFLAKKGVESPRLQTELLLAHLLKLPRMKLYLNFERSAQPGGNG